MTTTLVGTPDPPDPREQMPVLRLVGATSTWATGAAAGAAVLVTLTGARPPRA